MPESQDRMMDALVWTGPGEAVVQRVPRPVPAADEVLIEVAYCGICGSELSGFLGHNALRKPPLVMGHEFSGTIVAMGPETTTCTPGLTVGSRVTVDPMIYDGTCSQCRSGKQHLCLNRQLIGAGRPGAFAQYVTAPAHMVFLLPSEMTLRVGALSEPTACAVRAAALMGDVQGRDILIVGAGTIGLLTLQVLLDRGAARVFVSDTNTARAAHATAMGAVALDPRKVDVVSHVLNATDGEGVAVSMDAVGKAVTRAQCVEATARGGRVVLSGLHEETSSMPVANIIRKELVMQASFCYTPADVREAIGLLESGAVSVGDWVIDAPLADGAAWFSRLVGDSGAVAKVLLVP